MHMLIHNYNSNIQVLLLTQDIMSEEAPTLKWGDIIRIHGVNLSTKDQLKTKGLVISKGFTDPNIYYQRYDHFENVNFYRESLFQILPRSSFEMHDQMEQPNISIQQKQQLKNRVSSQINGLQANLKAKAGKNITYGSEVIFRHVQSQHYLRGILKAADTGEGAFKIEVTRNLSSQLVFRITSHRSYEKEKDKIYYDDALQIYHPKSDCFMNFSDINKPIYLDQDQQLVEIDAAHPFHNFSIKRPSIKKPVDKRISIVNQNKSKCLWKFIQHCTYQEYNNKTKIKSHDIVFFMHTKDNGLVSSTISKPTQYYLKQKGIGLFYQCFWQLIPKSFNELGPEQCDSFWVKNVITGQFLTFDGFKIQIQPQNINNQKQELKNQSLINLICSQPNEDGETLKLERGQVQPIREGMQKILEYYENKFEKVSFVAVPKMSKDIFKIFKVDEKTLLDLQFALSAHQPLVKIIEIFNYLLLPQQEQQGRFDYKGFFFSLNEDNLINIVRILKMLIGKIFNTTYQQIISLGNLPDESIQKIYVETGIVELTIQIINLLYDPFVFIESQTEPSADRAIRNRISQIFQFSYRLLQKSAVNNEDNRIYISRWVDLFLKHSKNINQSYIQECLVGILQNNQKSILATINKQKIVELIQSFFKEASKISTDTFLTTKYLRLFSTFIVCENRVLRENQNIILNQFFKNVNNQQIFRVKIEFKNDYQQDQRDPFSKLKSKQVLIAFGNQQYTTISKFFRDWTSKWNYFIGYINLLADICIDRNIEAIKNVSALLSLQMIATILFDPQLEVLNKQIMISNIESFSKTGELKFPVTNVHEPFIRIAHYLYINNEKFDPVKPIKKISRWYRGEENQAPTVQEINRTKRPFQGEKQEQQKKYLQSILLYIKKYLTTANQDPFQLSTLYNILDTLKTTIILGLWGSISQFHEIIPLIIMRITKIDNHKFFEVKQEERDRKMPNEIVEDNKRLLQMNRPEITKSIQCKIKATQIFRVMNQFQIDIRLRYIMNFFKGLYETTVDFNHYDTSIREDEINLSQDQNERQKIAKQEFFKVENKLILGEDVKKLSQDQQVILKNNVWLNKLKQLTPLSFPIVADKRTNRYLFQSGVQNSGENLNDKQVQTAMNIHFEKIILALLQLPVYQNEKLLNNSLKMLRSIFEQRKELLNNFQKILICGKGNLNEVYLTLKFMRNKFQMLTNLNIESYTINQDKSFPYALWKPYDSLVKLQDKRSGIIQDLFFLSRTLKDNISLKNIQTLMRVQEEAFDSKQVYNFIDERQQNNVLFQSLNIAEGIYLPLMQYLKIMNDKDLKEESIHYKLLRSIFQYLTQACYNNLQAKQLMIQYIPDVLPYLKKRVGASLFIYVVAYNNKTLISDEDLVKSIIDASLDACCFIDFKNLFRMFLNQFGKSPVQLANDYEKSQIFYSLRGICLFNNNGHYRNQQLLMNRLQQNKYRRLIYQQVIQFKGKIDQFQLSPDESYVTAHFEMLSSLIQSGNKINIGKLQNIHTYPSCLQSLKSTNRWQVRRALRGYINRLYYVNKQKDVFLFEQFIRKEFDIINSQLQDLVKLHKDKGVKMQTVIKNGIRFKFALSQIMLQIIEILISLHQILCKQQFRHILNRQLSKQEKYGEKSRPLHDKIVRLYKYLGCLNKIYNETRTISAYLRQVSNQLKQILENMQAKYIQNKSEPELQVHSSKAEVDEIGNQTEKKTFVYDYTKSFFRNLTNMIREVKTQKKLEKLREQFKKRQRKGSQTEKEMKQRCLFNMYNYPTQKLEPFQSKKNKQEPLYLSSYLQTNSSISFKVLAKPQISENKQNLQLNNRLALVKKMMDESRYFQRYQQQQHLYFVHILSKIDNTSKKCYESEWNKFSQPSKPVIPMSQMIKTTFNLMTKNSNLFKDQQKIFVIKLIRCYLTQSVEQNQTFKLSIDKWDSSYLKETKGEFQRRQKLIQTCGGSNFLISILSQEIANKIELLNETLLFGIAYLYGGNKICQLSILNHLKSDADNRMLLNLKKIIKKIGEFLIQVRTNKEKNRKKDFSPNIVDTFDYFSQDQCALKQYTHNTNDKFEMLTQTNNENALCRIFRFLQLFCENNNIQMKNFLYSQTNLDGNKKTNQVNFIEETCLLLRKFLKIMNNKVVQIPSNMIAFIGQITQLPCLQNQISLIKSTYFEDVSYSATFFEQKNNCAARGFHEEDQLNKLMQLYEQSITLALSNFEGNDQVIMSEFMNKCNPKYLWIVMRNNIWLLLQQNYSHLDYFDKSQDKIDAIRKTLAKFDTQRIQSIIQSQSRKEKVFTGRFTMILSIITILKKIEDFENETKNPEQVSKAKKFRQRFEISSQWQHISSFLSSFGRLLLSINVSTFNGQNFTFQNVYFPNHPVFNYLSNETKDYIMMSVKRDTRRDKLIQLTNFQENIFNEIQHNYTLNYYAFSIGSYQKSFPITSEFCQRVHQFALYCSGIVLILMFSLMYIDFDLDQMSSNLSFSNIFTRYLIRIFSFAQLSLTIFYAWLWLKMKLPLAIQKYDQSQETQDNIIVIEPYQFAQQQQTAEGWIQIVNLAIRIYRIISRSTKVAFQYISNSMLWNNSIKPVIAVTSESGFNSFSLFLLGSLLGTFYGVEWFSLHIFDLFTSISLLTNVFKAILNNLKILTIFSLLATAFIVVFNILSFKTYASVIYEDDIPQQSCQTIVDCLLELYTSGAIGDDMQQLEVGRFSFDTIYIVFMELLFQNLVGGIMIDAFAELKDQDSKRDEDKKGMCYICSMTQQDMEKNGQNFDKHIARHFLWNYVYYIYCLKKKDPTQYTGIQYLIKQQLQDKDISWFPDMGGGDSGGQIENVIKLLSEKIEKIQGRGEQLIECGKNIVKAGSDILKKQV